MLVNQIVECLEQKEVLLTKIMDLTKQIEVRCKQEDIDLEDFLKNRSVFLERIQKCDKLISHILSQLPNEQQTRLNLLIQAKDDLLPSTKQEQQIANLSKKCSYLRQKTIYIDKQANALLTKRCNELREKINTSWHNKEHTTMFHTNT